MCVFLLVPVKHSRKCLVFVTVSCLRAHVNRRTEERDEVKSPPEKAQSRNYFVKWRIK